MSREEAKKRHGRHLYGDSSTESSSNEREEIEDYKEIMDQLLQSTCAVYAHQVDRTKHLVFGSKIIQDTSLYASTIRRWYVIYKVSPKRDKRMNVRRVVRDLVESGCRFYQPAGDKKYSNLLLPVQDVDKIETRVIRDLQGTIRAEADSSDDPEEENDAEMRTYRSSKRTLFVDVAPVCHQEMPPVPHVDIPKVSCHTLGGDNAPRASEGDDVSSIHDVSIEVGNSSRSSASPGNLPDRGLGLEQRQEDVAGDPRAREQELLDPYAPIQLNRLESWSRRQLQAVECHEDESENQKQPSQDSGASAPGPGDCQVQETLSVAGKGVSNEPEESSKDRTEKDGLRTGDKKARSHSSQSNEVPVPAPPERVSITTVAKPSSSRRGSSSSAAVGVLPLLPRPPLGAMTPVLAAAFQSLPLNGHLVQAGSPIPGISPGEKSLVPPSNPKPWRRGPEPRNISSESLNISKKRGSRFQEGNRLLEVHEDVMPHKHDSAQGVPFSGDLRHPGPPLMAESARKMLPPRPSKRARLISSSPSKIASKQKSASSKSIVSPSRRSSGVASSQDSLNGERTGAKKASSPVWREGLVAASMDPASDQFKKIAGEMMDRLRAIEQRMQVMESQNRRMKQRLVDLEEEEERRGQATVHHATAVAASYTMSGRDSHCNEHLHNGGTEEHAENSSFFGKDVIMW